MPEQPHGKTPPDTNTLFLNQLKVESVVGVFDWERRIEQELLFDIELDIDMSAAASSDDVADALSYVDVAELVSERTRALAPKLLEHLAGELSTALFEQWPITRLRLKITKPSAVPTACGVGVEIVRHRGQASP